VWLAGIVAPAQTASPIVVSPAQVAVSQPLTFGGDDSNPDDRRDHGHQPLPKRGDDGNEDDALQTSPGPVINPQLGPRFAGVGASGSAPPDTNMAVGPNHILQTVNSRYAIYNKTGTLLVGPNSLSSLWAPLGAGNGCATNNGGDVVAQYDKLADRFVVTQLGGVSAPFSECIAVSKTSDPTGTYSLYSFNFGTTLNDYPKFGVWPTATNSAYLATYNLFANGATFTGGQLCAYDRTKMLAGDPTAQGICFTIANDGGYLPSDLDGSTAPLDGTPGYFLNFETLSSLRMFTLKPNFATPAASTLTQQTPDAAVAAFSEACGGGTCIPQSGTAQKLDSLGDRLMYRLAFRNFGDHEALVINHSVTVGASVGVRWYELRAPVSATSAFTLFQQGTFAPDASFRWMGSAAMDSSGDIGIGYSVSSATIHPAIRFTGRAPTDPPGTMKSETSLIEGTGSQTGGLSRWGDYSAMRIDPADDCTFWYTNEYLPANGSFNWSTFFGSFKMPGCGVPPTPDFSMSAAPSSVTLLPGQQGTSTITVTSLTGFSGAVGLTVSGCPTGAVCSLNPTSATPAANGSATSILTMNTGTARTGTYALTIGGVSGALSHSTTVTLIVNGPTPDFTISATPASRTVTRGTSTTYTVTVSPTNGFNGLVNLSASGLPARVTASFTPGSVTGSGNSTMSVTVNRRAGTGTSTLTIRGTSGTVSHSTTVTLVVQ
jgi:hypothetical protein